MIPRALILLLGCAFLGACSGDQRVDGLITQLKDPQRREQAIEGLLVAAREAPAKKRALTRQRVVYALMEAYRVDSRRGQIVAALALLRSKEAEQVFAAALGDAAREDEYGEAAIRSARLLGELGVVKRVPELIKALEKAHATPRKDGNIWLERTCIRALGRLGDRRATAVLIKVLNTAPGKQDFYLNKLAARALGELRDPKAAPHLVRSLGATAHGLLLLEESRRALCRLGGAARKALLEAATTKAGQRAAQAMAVLGDLGDTTVVKELAAMEPQKLDAEVRLARAETLLRLGHKQAGGDLLKLVGAESTTCQPADAAPLTTRRQAAALLGWYGVRGLKGLLECACSSKGNISAVLCWDVALAVARQGEAGDLAFLDAAARSSDEITQRYLKRYRARLTLMERCKAKASCLEAALSSKDWRERERAALMMAGKSGSATAARLAKLYAKEEHAQVRQAMLVALEQLVRGTVLPASVAEMLVKRRRKRKPGAGEPPTAALRSRVVCLAERLKRRKRKGAGK